MAPDSTQTTVQPSTAPTMPDLSGASQPGDAAAPAAPAATQTPAVTAPAAVPAPGVTVDPQAAAAAAAMAPFQTQMAGAATQIQELAKPAPPAPPPPHARLLAMVNGLALGLDSFGKAAATHGREGGFEEVQQAQAQEQQLKQQKAASAEAIKNQKIQQQITIFDTNSKLAQNAYLMARLPAELTKENLATKGAEFGLGEQEANFGAAHGGMQPGEFTAAISATTPLSQSAGPASQFFTTQANQQLGEATRVLGANDIYVQNLATTLANPKATAGDVWNATQRVQGQLGHQEKATDAQIKKDSAFANSTVGKLSDPKALADPGAQAAIQAAIDNPRTDPDDIPMLRKLIPAAAVAQKNAEDIKEHEARVQQLVNQGDPAEMGKLLATNAVTLGELKTRSTTPKFIDDSITAAQNYAKANHLPEYSAAERDAQAKQAGSEANVQFFRNTDSLLVKGGTLDQLTAAYKANGNGKIPAINTIENLRKAAQGNGPLAALYSAQLGVADDYSKVMSGVGSDTSRQQALDIINAGLSPDAQAAAINQIKKQVTSQRNGQVGKNPYLQMMFPDPSTREEVAGNAGTQPAVHSASQYEVQPPMGTPEGSKLMQVPGSPAVWVAPQNVTAAKNKGAVELQ